MFHTSYCTSLDAYYCILVQGRWAALVRTGRDEEMRRALLDCTPPLRSPWPREKLNLSKLRSGQEHIGNNAEVEHTGGGSGSGGGGSGPHGGWRVAGG